MKFKANVPGVHSWHIAGHELRTAGPCFLWLQWPGGHPALHRSSVSSQTSVRKIDNQTEAYVVAGTKTVCQYLRKWGRVLLRVYSRTTFTIFIEIGLYLTDKEQKISWHSFFWDTVYMPPCNQPINQLKIHSYSTTCRGWIRGTSIL